MLSRQGKLDRSLEGILESLTINDDLADARYFTRSREDYERLLRAALDGALDDRISVGRSGIYRDSIRINPPSRLFN